MKKQFKKGSITEELGKLKQRREDRKNKKTIRDGMGTNLHLILRRVLRTEALSSVLRPLP